MGPRRRQFIYSGLVFNVTHVKERKDAKTLTLIISDVVEI